MLIENIDYYINEEGNFVFTKAYHLKRGYCCRNKCLHCPWDYGKPLSEEVKDSSGQRDGNNGNS